MCQQSRRKARQRPASHVTRRTRAREKRDERAAGGSSAVVAHSLMRAMVLVPHPSLTHARRCGTRHTAPRPRRAAAAACCGTCRMSRCPAAAAATCNERARVAQQARWLSQGERRARRAQPVPRTSRGPPRTCGGEGNAAAAGPSLSACAGDACCVKCTSALQLPQDAVSAPAARHARQAHAQLHICAHVSGTAANLQVASAPCRSGRTAYTARRLRRWRRQHMRWAPSPACTRTARRRRVRCCWTLRGKYALVPHRYAPQRPAGA
jgi:hypothetical protein